MANDGNLNISYQNHLNNLNQHSYNLDRVNLTKESYKTVLSTYSSLKTSHKELKSISRKVDQSKIEDLKDQIEDLVEKSEDIANIIGNVQDEYVDEDELNQELEMLNDEFNVVPAYHDRVSIAQGSEKKEENEPSEVELSQMMSELEKVRFFQPLLYASFSFHWEQACTVSIWKLLIPNASHVLLTAEGRRAAWFS